jgi:hypothetical protein
VKLRTTILGNLQVLRLLSQSGATSKPTVTAEGIPNVSGGGTCLASL